MPSSLLMLELLPLQPFCVASDLGPVCATAATAALADGGLGEARLPTAVLEAVRLSICC